MQDVDWAFLLLATHDVKLHSFCCLLYFHNPWMSLTLTDSKYAAIVAYKDYSVCPKCYEDTLVRVHTHTHTHTLHIQ